MIIEKVEITNFRSIKDASIELGEITAILGKNGAGKSTLLYALESFFNPGHSYTKFDYYNHDIEDSEIVIQVEFGRLRPDEISAFGGYVINEKLVVAKVINAGGVRYYGTTPQIPEFVEIRKLGARDKSTAFRTLVDSGRLKDLGPAPRAAGEVDAMMDAYEAAHPEAAQPLRREKQFLGHKNIGGGSLDTFTRFVLVPAVRDAATETERKGVVSQLVELIIERRLTNREDFRRFKMDFAAEAEKLFHPDNLSELREFGTLITARLSRYAPGAELTVDFDVFAAPDIKIPAALVSVIDDKIKVPIRYTGHGLQRALILSLLEQLAQTSVASSPESEEGKDAPVKRPPDLILAIEEPELYLHPNRSRLLASTLGQLAQPPRDAELPCSQVVYVTHSPYFVDVEQFDNIRVARKDLLPTWPGTTRYTQYTKVAAAKKLAEVVGKDPKDFTASSFSTRCGHLLTALVNEGFFADAVIVVEGVSDAAAILAVQAVTGRRWEERGIVVVAAGGKNNIDRLVISFSGFGIPTYFLFDGDRSEKDAERIKQNAIRNHSLLRLGAATIEDFPSSGAHAAFACFEDSIETELVQAWGKDFFLQLRNEVAAECQVDKPSNALKNPDVVRRVIERAYAEGNSIPIIEALVGKAEAMLAQAVT